MRDAARAAAARAMTLTGAGRGLCAGGDITGFGEVVPEEVIHRGAQPFVGR